VSDGPDSEAELTRQAHHVRRRLRGGSAHLRRLDPRDTPGLPAQAGSGAAKEWARTQVLGLGSVLGSLQERMYARARAGVDRRRILLVLQGLDCSGKDGTVRSVVGAMNPLGMHIKAFGPPSEVERAHHYLWRVAHAMPPTGYVGVFNRSHYEDVLVARVHELVPEPVWRARYEEINAFEQALVADGLVLVKVMLHISPEAQRQRLLARLDDPTKRWKFHPADLDDRARWDDYQRAYGDVLDRCATAAPWHVVPADRKWYRNWAVANLLLAHLEELDLHYPDIDLPVAALAARLGAARGKANGR
jgi:PPK2 family polyphosphate:nucleotide phosphotransferase